jgi:hypothetical protein
MPKPGSTINSEYDSRVQRVSIGPAGMLRPRITDRGLEPTYCLHCHAPMGAVSSVIPTTLRGKPGVITICTKCEAAMGPLPAHAIGFQRYD